MIKGGSDEKKTSFLRSRESSLLELNIDKGNLDSKETKLRVTKFRFRLGAGIIDTVLKWILRIFDSCKLDYKSVLKYFYYGEIFLIEETAQYYPCFISCQSLRCS